MVDEYGARGFQVLAFPCNQFLFQEPGSHKEILDFVETNFGAKDKLVFFEKGNVNGNKTREVYTFLKHKLPNGDNTTDIKWNFTKFLIDHEGNPYKRYDGGQNPYWEMKEDIEKLLKKKKKNEY